ncbi:unnamed protein product [Clavelina lepadiformis]|uniref:Cytochrome P450 n=1 Tax=Clavelina lepadiformis TaxID=159417 RepID=A0ABP0F8U0_CLALP
MCLYIDIAMLAMSFLNDLYSSVNVVPFVAAVVGLLFLYWYQRPKNFPPGPRGIPLLGTIPFTGKYVERAAAKWSKHIYGPVMALRLGRDDVIVLNNLDSINKALVKQHTTFSGRPRNAFIEDVVKGGIVFVEGNFWKSQRKFGLLTLRGLGVGKKSMEEYVATEASYFNEAVRSENGKGFDISTLLHKAISNNICSVIFGKRYEYDDKEFEVILNRFVHVFDDPLSAAAARMVAFSPYFKKIPPFSFAQYKFLKNSAITAKFVKDIVQEHRDSYDQGNLRDFMDAFLKEQQAGGSEDFSDEQLLHYISELFIAGTETTSSTLNWALICLLHYPETQRNLRKEINRVIDAYGNVCMYHKPNMPYTNAFIQELMRYRTLAPLSVPHKTTESSELNGYFIPKGTTILPNLWAVHNDPDYWNEPDKFKPERFLDNDGQFVSSNHVIPFSVGPRHCLGEQLARTEIFIFLISLLQKFDILPDPDAKELPDINGGTGGLACVPNPYRVSAKEL